ncbi:MAG: hypothetical protein ACR2KV_01825 [Solirubrobacteraceae bacterium]
MADMTTIEETIRARLAEVQRLLERLRVEAKQLASLIAAFEPDSTQAVRRSAGGRRATARTATPGGSGERSAKPAAKRGRPLGGGNRAQQALARIAAQPGVTASDLARAMGISTNYLYRVLPRLEREAKIIKRGRGHHPATEPAPTDPLRSR